MKKKQPQSGCLWGVLSVLVWVFYWFVFLVNNGWFKLKRLKRAHSKNDSPLLPLTQSPSQRQCFLVGYASRQILCIYKQIHVCVHLKFMMYLVMFQSAQLNWQTRSLAQQISKYKELGRPLGILSPSGPWAAWIPVTPPFQIFWLLRRNQWCQFVEKTSWL